VKAETPFQFDLGLILVEVLVGGPIAERDAVLVLDTGAAMTALVPRVAQQLGYTAADAIGRTITRTAVGAERGHIVRLAMVANLGYDMDGVLGMDFLVQFNLEIRPAEQRIVAEKLG